MAPTIDHRLQDKILKYNAQVPRYTSYPSAPHFLPVQETAYTAALAGATGALSLYIHIPFCQQMCFYCGCNTTATRRYEPVAEYIPLLLQEIDAVHKRLPGRMAVSHVHFGGGSPDKLSAADFMRIMGAVHENFNVTPGAEIALELDPRGVTPEKAEAYAAAGATRVSLGVQDFSPAVQEAIGRIQPFGVVEKAVELLRGVDIRGLNLDLMYGLPYQTEDDVARTAGMALALAPDRIAVFGYAHVPWMKKHMRLIDDAALPDAALRVRQSMVAQDCLTTSGMVPIGIDHFVRPHDSMATALHNKTLVRNFQGYTTDDAAGLIGLGVSSIGKVGNGFFQNVTHMTGYAKALAAGQLPVTRGRMLTDDDRLRSDIISDLMCYLEVDVGAILAKHGLPVEHFDDILASMNDLVEDAVATVNGRRLSIHSDARQMARIAAARFDSYFGQGPAKHSQAA